VDSNGECRLRVKRTVECNVHADAATGRNGEREVEERERARERWKGGGREEERMEELVGAGRQVRRVECTVLKRSGVLNFVFNDVPLAELFCLAVLGHLPDELGLEDVLRQHVCDEAL